MEGDNKSIDSQMDGMLGSTSDEWSSYTDGLVEKSEPLSEITLKDAAVFLAEMTPIVGDALAAKEVYDELQKDEPNYYLVGALGGAALVWLIPGLGDVAAKAIKKGAKEVFDVAKRIEVDPSAVGSTGGNIRLKPKAKSNLEEWSEGAYFRDPDTGAPEQLYHGMGGTLRGEPAEFLGENLEPSYAGTLGPGTYLTRDPDTASNFAMGKRGGYTDEKFGGQVFPVYTNVTNIVDDAVISSDKELRKQAAEIIEEVAAEKSDPYLFGLVEKLNSDEDINLSSLFTRLEDGKVRSSGVGSPLTDLFESKGFEGVSVTTDKGFHEAVIFPGHGGQEYPRQNIKSSLQGPEGAYSRSSNDMRFAEGGVVMDSDKQTEAVFKSSRTEVDPVSGNEVPPGALPEEVRDDIDAKLSEGEYVVPADVLRYFGLKFFEDLRTKAKKNMEALDEGGRIGGEPAMEEPQPAMEEDDLPFDIRELQITEMPDEPEMGMANGGLVKQGYQDGGAVTQMANPFAGSNTVVGTDEYKTYKNDAGMIITVRFVEGKPMSYIPPGYTEQGAPTPEVQSTASDVMSQYEEGDGPTFSSSDSEPNVPISEMDATQLSTAYGQTYDPKSLISRVAPAAASVLLGVPVAGLVGRGINALVGKQRSDIEDRAKELGIDLDSIKDFNKDLGRDNFTSDVAFNNAMQSVAPAGMTYNPVTEGGEGGNYTSINPTTAPQTSSRPVQRPDRDGGGSSGSGSESRGGLGGFADSVAEAFGFDNARDAFDGGGRGASRNDKGQDDGPGNSNDAQSKEGSMSGTKSGYF